MDFALKTMILIELAPKSQISRQNLFPGAENLFPGAENLFPRPEIYFPSQEFVFGGKVCSRPLTRSPNTMLWVELTVQTTIQLEFSRAGILFPKLENLFPEQEIYFRRPNL